MTQGFAAQLAQDLPEEDVRHVLGVFAADLDRLWGVLSVTVDPGVFARTAHALAGAAGAVGAEGLETACRAAMMVGSPATLDNHRAEIGARVAEARAACSRHGAAPGRHGVDPARHDLEPGRG